MKYDRLIIEILMEAGSDGLTVRKVSRHVFNAVNGLFDEADIEAVHKLVYPSTTTFSPLNKAAEGANCLLAAVQNLNKQIFSCHFSKKWASTRWRIIFSSYICALLIK